MLLANKNAVVYGAAGAVGSAVARAFAREGAHVFLAGRTLETLDALAHEIIDAGGMAEAAQVDALDEHALVQHAMSVIETAGSLDITFNAIAGEDVFGTPIVEMKLEDFVPPIASMMTSHFLIAKAVVPHMAKQRSGVIIMITANVARVGTPDLVGSFGTVGAAIEGFTRQLAAEVGSDGIRVVCLRSAGSPDAPGLDQVMHDQARMAGITREELEARWAAGIPLRRLPKLVEIGNVAALIASDYASPLTGTVANATCGAVVD
ncbi:MAG: 3-oxoacyl-[acyl-carrier protein] reductase [uncultured Chloroflexia bacterium]|uniref:3-oxoacyl-[acyl-carrier protein] reductase n=1 Tax=uncultured Chloroflexia bacterium TaxID=1672391 RepID=A0A6J4IVY8_9CHLR|nr:MAG: 3-oxoacyl-[acyl-carrier protein] reductase [uncultured Chloroflexia bacterium]